MRYGFHKTWNYHPHLLMEEGELYESECFSNVDYYWTGALILYLPQIFGAYYRGGHILKKGTQSRQCGSKTTYNGYE